jgi:GAF domain-containing protein
MDLLDYDPDDLDVRIAELLVATSDTSDPLVHPKVAEALRLLRENLQMDVVFVSQFVNNRRTFRVVDSKPHNTIVKAGQSDPVEESWCQYVVDGRLPQLVPDAAPFVEAGTVPDPGFPIGTHLSTPILMDGGKVYGTLCCFSHTVKQGVTPMDLQRLQIVARLLAEDLQQTEAGVELELEPMQDPRSGGRQ